MEAFVAQYTVAQVGLGNRGITHLDGFIRNSDRFQVVAVCDLVEQKRREAAERFGVAHTYADARQMLADVRPDVFCFVTQPDVRLSMVELAAEYGVRALAFEKPMATSLSEAWRVTHLCNQAGIKAVVCHQHKYLTSFQKLRELLDAGEVGQVSEIHATCQAYLQQLGTHYMDYIIWANGGARGLWAVGHIHGRGHLADSHPSPDYLMGQVAFENGVRGIIECGLPSPSHMDPSMFWTDNRLTVHGTYGYAWADTNGRWGAFCRSSKGEVIGGAGDPWAVQEQERLQVLYLRDLADWLDDDAKPHPCRLELAYHGYEILEAMCLSALDHVKVTLPISDPASSPDIVERMHSELP
jgi:predicted dehydrogenase